MMCIWILSKAYSFIDQRGEHWIAEAEMDGG